MTQFSAILAAAFFFLLISFSTQAQLSLNSSTPHRNAVGVAVHSKAILEFSNNMDAGSAANSFVIQSNFRGTLDYSISVVGNTVTITPAVPFQHSEEITISISAFLKSTSNNSLEKPTSFRFQTATKPSIVIPPNFVRRTIAAMPDGYLEKVATADLDGDSDLDICFFSSQKIGWLENDGTGSFVVHEIAIINDFPNDVMPFDIDHDNDMDIISAASYRGITIYRNNGQGSFSESTNLSATTPSKLDVADFNGDGLSDIVYSALELQDENYVGGTYIYYQNESGTFTNTKIYTKYSYDAKIIDIDGDGDWEILQHNDSAVYYLMHNGVQFVAANVLNTQSKIQSVSACNLNNDAHADILLHSNEDFNSTVHVLFNNGDQNFTPKTLASGSSLVLLSSGDFDGDNDIDVNVIDAERSYVTLQNDGGNNFSTRSLESTRVLRYSEANTINGDFNGDGMLDFVNLSSNYQIDLNINTIFPVAADAMSGITPLTDGDADWGDYDDDGDLDLLTTGLVPGTSQLRTILLENTGGRFVEVPASLTPTFHGSCDWGDFDNDGDLDILLMGATSMDFDDLKPKTLIYKNEDNVFSLLESSETQLPKAWGGEARWADMNNDGWLDIVMNTEGFSGICKSDGHTNFPEVLELPFISQAGNIATGDYDHDGDLDIAKSGWIGSDAMLDVLRNDENWKFNQVEGNFSKIYGGSLEWADMDADGNLDLVASGQERHEWGPGISTIRVYKNNNNSFELMENTEALYHTDSEGATAVGDYNNDGSPDVICSTSGGTSFDPMLTLLVNNGFGGLTAASIDLPRLATRNLTWGDYDLDGDLDIFTGESLLRNNIEKKNSRPVRPSGMRVDSVVNNTMYLSWEKGSDHETAQTGLSYQIYVGTQSHSQDVVSSNANVLTGFRKVAARGSSKGTTASVKNLAGGVYFFGAQSIDASFEGSLFSEEAQVFVIGIHGPPSSCLDLTSSYTAFPSGNYTWEVAGGSIVSGQGSGELTVLWDKLGEGYVRVTNATGSKNTLIVNVDETPQPVITGDQTVCTGENVYSISDRNSFFGEWSVSGILEAESSTTAHINFQEAKDYVLTAKAYSKFKGCFADAALQVSVDQTPDATITQQNTACEAAPVLFSTPAANVEWNVIGGTIVKDRGNSVEVQWAKVGTETIQVVATSQRSFCIRSSELSVEVHALPPKPTLELEQDTIIFTPTPSPTGYYQWYYNNKPVMNAHYNGLIPYVSGFFMVEIFSLEGCGHKSDHFFFGDEVTPVEKDASAINAKLLNVFPNPANESIYINLPDEAPGVVEILIISSVTTSRVSTVSLRVDELSAHRIDVSRLSPGAYVVEVRTKDATYQAKFIKM